MEPAIAVSSVDEEWDNDELEEHDEVEANSEPVDRYASKLYYPLSIREVLDRKYKIVYSSAGAVVLLDGWHTTQEK
jgi:hypothetical protein